MLGDHQLHRQHFKTNGKDFTDSLAGQNDPDFRGVSICQVRLFYVWRCSVSRDSSPEKDSSQLLNAEVVFGRGENEQCYS